VNIQLATFTLAFIFAGAILATEQVVLGQTGLAQDSHTTHRLLATPKVPGLPGPFSIEPLKDWISPELYPAAEAFDQGDLAGAIKLVDGLVSTKPGVYLHKLVLKGLCFQRLKRFDAAVAEYAMIENCAENGEVLYKTHGLIGLAKEGISDIPLAPRDRSMTYSYAWNYDQSMDFAVPLKAFLDKKLAGPVELFEAGKYDRAISSLDKEPNRGPSRFFGAHYLKGLCLQRLGRFDEGVKEFAMVIDGSNNRILRHRACMGRELALARDPVVIGEQGNFPCQPISYTGDFGLKVPQVRH
jgi:tetratricopeptide (TPR) repeat protein